MVQGWPRGRDESQDQKSLGQYVQTNLLQHLTCSTRKEGNILCLPQIAQWTFRLLNLRGPTGSPRILMTIETSLFWAGNLSERYSCCTHALYEIKSGRGFPGFGRVSYL